MLAGHERDIAIRQKFGVSSNNFKRALLGDKTTAEEYLEDSYKYKSTVDMVHLMVREAVADGPTTEVEQSSLRFLIGAMGEIQKFEAFSRSRYEAAKNGNNSSIREVFDG